MSTATIDWASLDQLTESALKGQVFSILQQAVFKFLRSAEYGLPEYCALIETFIRQIFPAVSYSLFLAELPRWFRPEVLKILEEQGVPIQISERVFQAGDTVRTLDSRLRDLALHEDPIFSDFERDWILTALPG